MVGIRNHGDRLKELGWSKNGYNSYTKVVPGTE
jgi:hypothetical protein